MTNDAPAQSLGNTAALFGACCAAHPTADAMELASMLWLASHANARLPEALGIQHAMLLANDVPFLVAVADAALAELGPVPFGGALDLDEITDVVDGAILTETGLLPGDE